MDDYTDSRTTIGMTVLVIYYPIVILEIGRVIGGTVSLHCILAPPAERGATGESEIVEAKMPR